MCDENKPETLSPGVQVEFLLSPKGEVDGLGGADSFLIPLRLLLSPETRETNLPNSCPSGEGSYEGFPGGAGGKESACYCRRCERCTFQPRVKKIPLRRKRHPTPVSQYHSPKTRKPKVTRTNREIFLMWVYVE